MFYLIVGRDKRDHEVAREVVFEMAMASVIARLLTREDVKTVVVSLADDAAFRKFQRERKK